MVLFLNIKRLGGRVATIVVGLYGLHKDALVLEFHCGLWAMGLDQVLGPVYELGP